MKPFLAFLPIIGLLLCMTSNGQKKSDIKTSKRHVHKEFKQLSKQDRCDTLATSLEGRHWIAEAERVPGKRGSSIIVEPGSSFVAVNDNTIHFAINDPYTQESQKIWQGFINDYSAIRNKENSTYLIEIDASLVDENIHISMEAFPSGEVAWVKITGKNLKRYVFVGQVIPLNYSLVYKVAVIQD